MRRLAWIIPFVALLGCSNTPENVLQEPPPALEPVTYEEEHDRLKRKVWATQELFYVGRWADVDKASRSLAITASHLKAMPSDKVPADVRDVYKAATDRLAKAADSLSAASKAESNLQTTDAFQELHLVVRELQPKPTPPAPAVPPAPAAPPGKSE